LLFYADDINLLGENLDIIKKNKKETLFDTRKKAGLEVNVEKTKYILLSRPQNAGQNYEIKIGDRSFENVTQFKYLGSTVTNQNLIQEEIKRRLNSGNAYYHSVQNLLSSRLLSKSVKICNILVLPVILYGCETWSLTLKEEHTLRVFENRVMRRICGEETDEVIGCWRKLHNVELHNVYSMPKIIRMIKSRRMRWEAHAARTGRRGMHLGFWWKSQKERDH
jgi:hypothetical protein